MNKMFYLGLSLMKMVRMLVKMMVMIKMVVILMMNEISLEFWMF